MPTWGSRGLRGSALEDMINFTIEQYRMHHLALIQKIPTPIKPIQIEKETRHITLAYFDQKSTVDYIGVVQGIPVCFDAKECATGTFPLQNLHEHQMNFMEEFEQQGGIAFILLYYTHLDQIYYVPCKTLKYFWDRGKAGGKKSFHQEELMQQVYYPVVLHNSVYVRFLEALQMDLDARDKEISENS